MSQTVEDRNGIQAAITRSDVWAACLQSSLLLMAFAAILRLTAPSLSTSILHTDTPRVLDLLMGEPPCLAAVSSSASGFSCRAHLPCLKKGCLTGLPQNACLPGSATRT